MLFQPEPMEPVSSSFAFFMRSIENTGEIVSSPCLDTSRPKCRETRQDIEKTLSNFHFSLFNFTFSIIH